MLIPTPEDRYRLRLEPIPEIPHCTRRRCVQRKYLALKDHSFIYVPESVSNPTSTNQMFLHTVFPDLDLDLSMQLPSRKCLIVHVVGIMHPQPCSLLRVFITNILCILGINFFELSLEIVELALQIEQIPGAQIFKSAIDRCIFVLGDELCEGRVPFESPSRGRHRLKVDV